MRDVSWALNQTQNTAHFFSKRADPNQWINSELSGYTINYEPLMQYHTHSSSESNKELYTKMSFRCENYEEVKLFLWFAKHYAKKT
jgi:hypothetical protein